VVRFLPFLEVAVKIVPLENSITMQVLQTAMIVTFRLLLKDRHHVNRANGMELDHPQAEISVKFVLLVERLLYLIMDFRIVLFVQDIQSLQWQTQPLAPIASKLNQTRITPNVFLAGLENTFLNVVNHVRMAHFRLPVDLYLVLVVR
jgi:hypothetical protein